MKTASLIAGCVLAAGCAGPRPAPEKAPAPAPEPAEIRLPDRITLPASYRLILLDGHLALVREADPEALASTPASLRIVTGELANGELAYQPGLLPQELAAEVASGRASSARMEGALDSVLKRSRELSDQALQLEAQSRRLADMLAAANGRIAELEAARHPAPQNSPDPDPGPPHDPPP